MTFRQQLVLELLRRTQFVNATYGGGWQHERAEQIAWINETADLIAAACDPVVIPATVPGGDWDAKPGVREATTDRQHQTDAQVIACLDEAVPATGGQGPNTMLWMRLCASKGIGRRAYESSRARLIASGVVKQVGTRFLRANTPST